MADVIIRGMEMPQRCKACRFCGFGGRRSELNVCMFTGESQPKLSQERMSKCPLVPLPEGHGRLIDADALDKFLAEREKEAEAEEFYLAVAWYNTFRQILIGRPTIVPAEGGTEDGN